jgi:hypothetical protein
MLHALHLSLSFPVQQPHTFVSSKLLLTQMHANLSRHVLAAFMLGRGANWRVMRCTVNRMLLAFPQSQQHHCGYGENNTWHAEELLWQP